jgi:hypothetical protein
MEIGGSEVLPTQNNPCWKEVVTDSNIFRNDESGQGKCIVVVGGRPSSGIST